MNPRFRIESTQTIRDQSKLHTPPHVLVFISFSSYRSSLLLNEKLNIIFHIYLFYSMNYSEVILMVYLKQFQALSYVSSFK